MIRARRVVPGYFPRHTTPPSRLPPIAGASLWRGLRVGLLGGSFNPAHDGHRYISVEAMKRLGLDAVWWIVSPGNPLKDPSGMAPLERRLAVARRIADHPRIHVDAPEARLGTRYTADTLPRLRRAMPRTRFVWLMGADNLAQVTKWQRWQAIVDSMPLAVIDRDGYSIEGLGSLMAVRYRHSRLCAGARTSVATTQPPVWTFIPLRRHPQSATAIRARRQGAGAA